MSTSARRLAASVATDRFAWQVPPAPEPLVLAVSRQTGPAAAGAPHQPPVPMRDLPTPAAERIEAADREGYARGFADGQRAAAEAAAAAAAEQARETAGRLAEAIQDLANVRSVLMRRSERDLVRLAVAMAGRILRRQVEIDRELLVVMARVAIDRLGENVAATVHLNPDDHALIVSRSDVDPGRTLELQADAAVPRGGCLVRSGFGTVDVGIESQVRELSRALLGEDPGEHPEGIDATPSGA